MFPIRLNPSLVALAAAALLSGGAAQASSSLSLNDFLPPAQGGPTQAAGKVSTAAGGKVTQGENMQDAMVHAYNELAREDSPGVRMVSTKTGMGVIALGKAQYSVYQNPNATRLSKRAAYVRAYVDAQKQLVEHAEGLSSTCENAVSSRLFSIDTGAESAANVSSSAKEVCRSSVKGMLDAFVTYNVNDDVADREVTVAIASSTKTKGAFKRSGPAIVSVEELDTGFKEIVAEVTTGVIPPVGARLLTKASTGEDVLIGFGSSVIRENRNKFVANKLKDAARKQAELRAQNALVAFLSGSEVYWSGGFDEKQLESTEQFEIPKDPNTGKPTDPQVYKQDKERFLNELRQSDDYKTVTSGRLPPGVQIRTFASKDGEWMLAIAVYRPAATTAAQQLGSQGSVRSSDKRPMEMNGGRLESGGRNTRGPSGQVSSRRDF